MQWTIFVLSSAILVTARTRSYKGEQVGLEPFETSQLYENKDRLLWNPKYQKDLFAILNQLDEKNYKSDSKIMRKRALSALTRWKPLGNLGIRMKVIHRSPSRAPMISMVPEMNLISSESNEGYRQVAQPLRWGRKR